MMIKRLICRIAGHRPGPEGLVHTFLDTEFGQECLRCGDVVWSRDMTEREWGVVRLLDRLAQQRRRSS